jgi:hypothetical protein
VPCSYHLQAAHEHGKLSDTLFVSKRCNNAILTAFKATDKFQTIPNGQKMLKTKLYITCLNEATFEKGSRAITTWRIKPSAS